MVLSGLKGLMMGPFLKTRFFFVFFSFSFLIPRRSLGPFNWGWVESGVRAGIFQLNVNLPTKSKTFDIGAVGVLGGAPLRVDGILKV